MSETNSISDEKRPATKEKLRSIMEAASALTALGDEESDVLHDTIDSAKKLSEAKNDPTSSKRFLPEYKKPDAAPTFPEKLMSLMKYADTQGKDFCVTWLPDGKSFVIKHPDEFTRCVVPKFFKATKFSSFTRKLYRWGFRQINRGIGPDDPIIFGNEYFERDAEHHISKMRSITAAANRKPEPESVVVPVAKRPLEVTYEESSKQRILFDHLLQQKAASLLHQHNSQLYAGLASGSTLSLTSALNPNVAMDRHGGQSLAMSMNQSNFSSSLGNKFEMLSQQQKHLVQQHPTSLLHQFGMQQGLASNFASAYPNSQSTAEIVNAAIAALRYAN